MIRSMMRRAVTGLAFVLLALPAAAQEAAPQQPTERDSLERRVRERMAQVIKRQVGLNDDQMRRLGVTNRRFEGQQRELFMRERRTRMELRNELDLADTTRQAQVSTLLDQMLQIQKQRVELVEAEQRELATFMTPQQRARYLGIQEQVRRRVDEMRDQGGNRGPGGREPGGMRPPPGARRPAGAPVGREPRTGATRPPA